MAEMPPLPKPPADAPLTASELFPFRSKKISLRKSRAFVPLLATGLTSVLLLIAWALVLSGQSPILYMNILAVFVVFMIFAGIYYYSGERKRMIWYLIAPLIVLIILSSQTLSRPFFWLFREVLPGRTDATDFIGAFWGMLFAAGLMEELLKVVPILLIALPLGYRLRARGGQGNFLLRGFALHGPVDGILMGVAAGAGFILIETLGQYVPNAVRSQGQLQGLLLLLPRVLNGAIGHMAYSGIFGYFLGLAVSHKRALPMLFLVGWLLSAVLHAFWNSAFHLLGLWGWFVSAGLTLFFFLACLVKAKQLDISRLGGPISGRSILAVSPPAGTTPLGPAGIVPPSPGGMAGILTGAATAAEALAGVTARTTEAAASTPGATTGAPPVTAAPVMAMTGLSIGNALARYALAPHQAIDFSTLFAGAGIGPNFLGTILPAPEGGLLIANTGAAPWTYATPDGQTVTVAPGASLRPLAGARLGLGAIPLDIQAY